MATSAPTPLTIVIDFTHDPRRTTVRVRHILRQAPAGSEVLIIGPYDDPAQAARLKQLLANFEAASLLGGTAQESVATLWARAAKRATSPLVLYLLPGVQFTSRTRLPAMMARADTPTVGAVGCVILDAKQQRIEHGGIFKLGEHPYALLYQRQRFSRSIRHLKSRTFPYDIRKSRPVTGVLGAVMIRRSVMRQQRAFLTAAQAENAEQLMLSLCLRLNQAGKQTWLCGSCRMLAEQPFTANFQPLAKTNDTIGPDPYLPDLERIHVPSSRPQLPRVHELLKRLLGR